MCPLTEGRSFADQSEGGCDYSNFEGGVIIVNGGVYAAATLNIQVVKKCLQKAIPSERPVP